MSILRRDRGINATINFSLKEMRDNKPADDAWEGDGIYLTNIVPGTVTHRYIVRHLWNVNAAKSVEYLQRAGWCIGLDMPADLPKRVGLRKWVLQPGVDTTDIEVVSHRRNFERPLSEVEDDIRQNSGLTSGQMAREVAHVRAQYVARLKHRCFTGTPARFLYSSIVSAGSRHPTVKPVDLIRQVRLITSPGGVVLDPFAGSGTTHMRGLRRRADRAAPNGAAPGLERFHAEWNHGGFRHGCDM